MINKNKAVKSSYLGFHRISVLKMSKQKKAVI